MIVPKLVTVFLLVEMLKLLFPGDQDYIQQKAEEHKRSRIIAGANVRSDIEAGEALGKAIAAKTPTMTKTTMISINVNPLLFFSNIFIHRLL